MSSNLYKSFTFLIVLFILLIAGSFTTIHKTNSWELMGLKGKVKSVQLKKLKNSEIISKEEIYFSPEGMCELNNMKMHDHTYTYRFKMDEEGYYQSILVKDSIGETKFRINYLRSEIQDTVILDYVLSNKGYRQTGKMILYNGKMLKLEDYKPDSREVMFSQEWFYEVDGLFNEKKFFYSGKFNLKKIHYLKFDSVGNWTEAESTTGEESSAKEIYIRDIEYY